jgi:hypothetical protein
VIKQGGQGLSLARPADLFLKKHDPPDGEASGESELEASLPSAAAKVAAASGDISVDRHRSVGAWTVSQHVQSGTRQRPRKRLGWLRVQTQLGALQGGTIQL